MTSATQRDGCRVVRGATNAGSWELVFGRPHRALAPYVRDYCGYFERTRSPQRRREMPGAQVVMIIDFGPTLGVLDAAGAPVRHAGGFFAGLDDGATLTETAGAMEGIQVNFTPPGASLFVDGSMSDLSRRVVGLRDLLGAEGAALTETLYETTGWAARFTQLDRIILSRIEKARDLPAWIEHGWRRIERAGGALDIGALAHELGFSRKHVAVAFRERMGMPPKALAGLVRFERALAALRAEGRPSLAQLALDLGYCDQAHFTREVSAYAGLPPAELSRRSHDETLGVLA